MGCMDHPECERCKLNGTSIPKFWCPRCGTKFCGRCEAIPEEQHSWTGRKTCPECGERDCTQNN